MQVGRRGVGGLVFDEGDCDGCSAALLQRASSCLDSDLVVLSVDADGPAPLELPNQWLWDIIDEFIYQVFVQPQP